MQDKPTSIELLEALAAFLREEVAPRVDGGLRFKAIVGANVAGIVAREIALGPAADRDELARLTSLLGDDAASGGPQDVATEVRRLSFELCRRIDAGDGDDGPWRRALLDHLRRTVDAKLSIDSPRIRPHARD
jgi:hypothetical protein